MSTTKPIHGRNRVVIEEVTPQIGTGVNAGLYPACRIVGDEVVVSAAIFADGHDHLAARLLYRKNSDKRWISAPMTATSNDLWTGSFQVDKLGSWSFTVQGWIDHFDTWVSDTKKRLAAQPDPQNPDPNATPQDIPLAFRSGAILIRDAAKKARGADSRRLLQVAESLTAEADQNADLYEYPLTPEIEALVSSYPDLTLATRYAPELPLWVDRERARFSAWYELFPRSASSIPGQHGTFADVENQLPEIAEMGFDVLYLPPIHPIGRAFRKGPNNSTTSVESDLGSPWAIGDKSLASAKNKEDNGGHKSIHPQLGTFKSFDKLVAATKAHGLEIALDIAFQCSPDHPWVTEHPDWFVTRPDGSIQYAENPPKKYQDIYPLNFESHDWRGLWDELYSVFEFWIKRGVHIFRVDNPHTKALPFWEWCLGKLREHYPDTLFLAEAFTRPHVMYSLAKRGFTQSYTYFTWRTDKDELQTYLEEITRPPVSDFFQPNFWPNTPDILHRSLQQGGRPAFMQRLILAATMTANYGIYGPAYELGENTPATPPVGKTESEEYLDSEKFQIRQRDRNGPGTIVPLITSLNQIRRANPALQSNLSLHFHDAENPQILCYSKSTSDFENTVLVAINLDPFNEQSSWIHLDLEKLGIPSNQDFIVEDLLTGVAYTWQDRRNYVALKPDRQPAHIFRIIRPV
ncbi:alpha-1,4-glucan--maltose-1-phosphate maltosyltransferase [Acidicapsa ligni]|uniref:alpha-1,4-glucan--maltose-1-phosphate maltosyltransferase n=1 Tax=Acidicapsa ligni TaxID=542300 RepID=UPI0021DF54EB|nr:alpha-1,4-glucan--maltose-1-phosphate maltosyltransferase [Acidicapsa ligni]